MLPIGFPPSNLLGECDGTGLLVDIQLSCPVCPPKERTDNLVGSKWKMTIYGEGQYFAVMIPFVVTVIKIRAKWEEKSGN